MGATLRQKLADVLSCAHTPDTISFVFVRWRVRLRLLSPSLKRSEKRKKCINDYEKFIKNLFFFLASTVKISLKKKS